MSFPKDRVVVASDVNPRDGIGVEIFRDDREKTRTVTVFKESISLELMEESIQIFKKAIPWDFIACEE